MKATVSKYQQRYSSQLIIPRNAVNESLFPSWFIANLIGQQLTEIAARAREKGDRLKWDTFIASSREDNLADAVLLNIRINAR
jgi:hypothetical protein